MFPFNIGRKKTTVAKNKLPEKLVAIKDDHQPAWVWDPEYRVIVWANNAGLAFWNVNSRNEIKELIFPESHSMVVVCDGLFKRARSGKIMHNTIALVDRAHASVKEYDCKIEAQTLPDGRDGLLIVVKDHIASEETQTRPYDINNPKAVTFDDTDDIVELNIDNGMTLAGNHHINIEEDDGDYKEDDTALSQQEYLELMKKTPATFTCNKDAIIAGFNETAQKCFDISSGTSLVSVFKDKDVGEKLITHFLKKEKVVLVEMLDLGYGLQPFMVQSNHFDYKQKPHFNVGIMHISQEKYDEFQLKNGTSKKLDSKVDLEKSSQTSISQPQEARNVYDDNFLASSVMGDLAGVDVGIFDVDLRGGVTKVNQMACTLMGFDKQEALIGQNVVHLFGLEAQPVLTELLINTNEEILDDLADGVQCVFNDGQGIERIAKLIVRRNRNKDGYWFLLNDNTEIEKMKSELYDLKEHAEKSISPSATPTDDEGVLDNDSIPALVSAVSHEIRAPLNAISGYAEMIQSEIFGALPDKRYHEFISSIRGASEYALSIISELLDYSKLKAGGFIAHLQEIDLENVMDDAIATVYPMAYARKISINKTFLPNTPYVTSDQRLLKQILINLLTNAIKFSPDEGDISFTAGATKSGRVMIEVKDFGRGMTEEEIHKALTPFNQGHYENDIPGTGLGLSLSKEMTELTKGRFLIDSLPGKSTRVRVIYEKAEEE